MDQFFIVLHQIGIYIILLAVGYITVKTDILDETGLGRISKLVMRVLLPSFIFLNTAEGATRAGLAQSLLVLPLGAAMYLLLAGLAWLLGRVFHLEGNRRRVLYAVVMFGNIGFMGIPLLVELYPENALVYISLLTILDQGLFWTLGLYCTKPVTGEKTPLSLAGLKMLINPALIAVALSTVLVLLGWHLPEVVNTTLDKLGGASMPLALIYIGGMLCLTDVRPVLRCGELYAMIAVKMIVLPVACYAVMRVIGVHADMAGTMAFVTGLPSITTVAMLARQNGSDADYTVCAAMMTTVACLVTMPLAALMLSVIG